MLFQLLSPGTYVVQWLISGPRLNEDSLSNYGNSHNKDKTVVGPAYR